MIPSSNYDDEYAMGTPTGLSKSMIGDVAMPMSESAPVPEASSRLVVQNSHLSLLVKNVAQSVQSIKTKAEEFGGYMVDSNVSNPDEAGTGNITVRIPSDQLDEILTYFRGLAVKVVSENLKGTDVTDQYVDIEERIAILERNKTRFQEIMNDAQEVSDILQIQREILNLQSQIDSLKGQQNYLAKTAQFAKVTVYLSTDELELPYAPAQAWRPEVIFKTAVRSLVGNLRNLGTLLIWTVVYAVVWVPVALVVIYIIRRKKKSQ